MASANRLMHDLRQRVFACEINGMETVSGSIGAVLSRFPTPVFAGAQRGRSPIRRSHMTSNGSLATPHTAGHGSHAVDLRFTGPAAAAGPDCERILRSLPDWFGIEQALQDYVADADRHPTFFAVAPAPVAFITVRQHGPQAWEVHCMAVHAACRGTGIGRRLHAHVESWLQAQGALVLQVKTLAPSHPSAAYAETRGFYGRLGYLPLEVFPALWGPRLPVLQLVKWLGGRSDAAAPGA